MPKVLKTIWDEFIYGGHIQCLGALGLLIFSYTFLGFQLPIFVLLSVYIMTYLTYSFNRCYELNSDIETNPERSSYLSSYYKFYPLIATSLLLIITILQFLVANIYVTIFLVLVTVLGLLYTLTVKQTTRYVYFAKNIYVALAFSIVLYLPVINNGYGKVFNINSLNYIAVFVFIYVFIMQIFLDVKDFQSDKTKHLKTLPVLLGADKTIVALEIANLLLIMLLIFGFFASYIPGIFLILLIPIALNYVIYFLMQNNKKMLSILLAGLSPFILSIMLIIVNISI